LNFTIYPAAYKIFGMRSLKNYIKLMRLHHWVKNLLVFAPLFFAKHILDLDATSKGILLFFSFSLLSSCVYIINDLIDVEYDKLHPGKQNRPLAAGEVSKQNAIVLAIILVIVSGFLCYTLPIKAILILFAYLVVNIVYSFRLKQIPLLDIFIVASFYLMRIYAGGTLWREGLSHWLILCTFFLALFLIVAKRRAEFCEYGGQNAKTRKVMESYNKEFLDHMLVITITTALTSYSIYVISTATPYLLYSVFFVAFGLFRYLYIINQHNAGHAPEKTLFSDKWILGSVIFWLLLNAILFYL